MSALLITGCLLAAILVLLLIPARARFEYKGNVLKADLRYLFLRFDFFPKEDVKKAAGIARRAAKKELKKQEKEETSGPKEPKGAIDTAKTILTLIKAAKWGLDLIVRSLVFYGVRIYISVSEGDAHKTAESYGRLCAYIYPSLQVFREAFTIREPDIVIAPDFLSARSRCEIAFKVRLTPLVAVIALVNALTQYIRMKVIGKNKRRKIKNKNRRKKYEPATSGK